MKQITIGNWPDFSLKEFAGMYLSSFSVLWLVIEPLGTFGVLPNATGNMGWLGYLILIFVALLISVFISNVWQKLKFNRQEFTNVIVESSTEGITYKVKVPANTQVWDFTHLFIEHLEKGPASERVRALNWYYSPVLNVKRNGEISTLDNNITIKDAGLGEGDILYISGELIKRDLTPNYSRKSK